MHDSRKHVPAETTTQAYLPGLPWHLRWLERVKMFFRRGMLPVIVWGMAVAGSFTLFFCAGRYVAPPRYVIIEKEKIVMVPANPELGQKNLADTRLLDLEANRMAVDLMKIRLEKGYKGLLILKDKKALTVQYKRAALGGNGKYFHLSNGPYVVRGYVLYKEVGRGILEDEIGNLIPFEWQPGATKAPDLPSGSVIRLTKGIEIEIGGPLP